jgi:hypothetical protein
MIKNGKNCGEKLKDKLIKHIEIFKDGISLGVYESAKQIEEQSERLFWN